MTQIYSQPLVKLVRQSKGLKAKEIAAKLNISASYYSELEAGKKPWPPEILRKLSEDFGIGTPLFSAAAKLSEEIPADVAQIVEDSHRSPFAKHTEDEIWDYIEEAARDARECKPLNQRMYLTNIQDAAEELKGRLPAINYRDL